MKLSQKLMVLTIISILLITLLTYIYLIPAIRTRIYTEKDQQLHFQVDNIESTIYYFYNLAENGILSIEDAQKQAIALTSAIRYGDNSYFWIDDLSHISVMHGDLPQTVGTDRSDLQDIHGTYTVREYVQGAVAHPTEGYYLNLWYTKPDAPEKPLYRRVYAKLFQPWGWIICTGITVADVEKTIAATIQGLLAINILLILVVLPLIGWLANRSFLRPLHHIIEKINQMASRSGDLSQSIEIKRRDELGILAGAVNNLIHNLRQLIGEIDQVSTQLTMASQELTENAQLAAMVAGGVALSGQQASSGAENQLTVVTTALQKVETVTAGIASGAANATATAKLADQTAEHAHSGAAAVERAIGEMHHIQSSTAESVRQITALDKQSKEIGQIIETITVIARQTNLLALNAAIEASRAGEHGHGFAIVAGEVRKLAEASHVATRQIANLIHAFQSNIEAIVAIISSSNADVQKGAESVDLAGQAFKTIHAHVVEVAQTNTKTADSLAQLANQSQDVLDAVKEVETISRAIAEQARQISAATQEQSAAIEEMAASSKTLDTQAANLHESLGQFRI